MPAKKSAKYTGLNKVKKTLADGNVREIYYWRGLRGIPALPGNPGEPAFEAAYRAGPPKSAAPTTSVTFSTVIDAYVSSNDFHVLGERTKKDYAGFMKIIRAKWGTAPLVAFKDPLAEKRFRAPLLAWRDEWASRSARQAQYCFVVMTKICNVGIERGLIDLNPCAGQKTRKLYQSDRATIIWSDTGPDNDFDAFLNVAAEHLHLPLILGGYTGQREGDLIRLRYRNPDGIAPYYDGQTISLRVSKTKTFVRVPLLPAVRAALDAEVARAKADHERQKWDEGHLLVTTKLTPWTEDGFRSSFFKARNKARNGKGIKADDGRHKTFHDLRGTACTMLALADCSPLLIASITGHSDRTVSAILSTHYIGERTQMAEEAIRKLEKWFANRSSVSVANRAEAA